MGRTRVAGLFAGLFTKVASDVEISVTEVNGEPGVLTFSGSSLLGVLPARLPGKVFGGYR